MNAWEYLEGIVGNAWERMYGSVGNAWARLPGKHGNAWQRLIFYIVRNVVLLVRATPSWILRAPDEAIRLVTSVAPVATRISHAKALMAINTGPLVTLSTTVRATRVLDTDNFLEE